MEIADPLLRGMAEWKEIAMCFFARFESTTRQEEPAAALDRLLVGEFRTDGIDDHAAVISPINKNESTAPVTIPAHWDSDAKLRFLIRAVNGTTLSPHASFRLPAVLTYAELVDCLFQDLRTLHSQSDLGHKHKRNPSPR